MKRQQENMWMDKVFAQENMMRPNCVRIWEELVTAYDYPQENVYFAGGRHCY